MGHGGIPPSDQGRLKEKKEKEKESKWETNNNYLSATCRRLREYQDGKNPKWYIRVLKVE